MCSVCFIVASSSDREHLLKKCMECYSKSQYSVCDIYLYFQGETTLDLSMFKGVIMDKDLRGVFTPRYELMKQFAKHYDYVVIIDDDLFIETDTDYYSSIQFLEEHQDAGCICISNNITKDLVEKVKYINITGGMVLPRKSVEIILDYFKDKERDYSYDGFWLLLYVKGLNWYKDWRTRSEHRPTQKVNGEYTGYNKVLVEKEYVPFLEEYFNIPKKVFRHNRYEHDLMTLKDLNENGSNERRKNYV